MNKAMVFDIQRFAVHDGPGIRTNVFFKGCPLRCAWCCNPESQTAMPQIGHDARLCIGCGKCAAVCLHDSVRMEPMGHTFDPAKCTQCLLKPCVKSCSPQALTQFGRKMTVDDLMAEVAKDEPFYNNSGGGVTASGGEPLLQSEFVRDFFRVCRERGYHTAIETSSHCRFEAFLDILPHTSLFLCDIKHMDEGPFRQMAGGDISLVLDNIAKLAELTPHIVIRVPVIPGFNDSRDVIGRICAFARDQGIEQIHFLPYHRLGKSKYDKLHAAYGMEDTPIPEKACMTSLAALAGGYGLTAAIGG